MKKKFSKIFAVGSAIAMMGVGIYAYGCADGWWGAGYRSIFSPEITVNNKSYEPFFYDDYTTFYNGYNIQSTTDLFKEETVNDWQNYIGKYNASTIAYYLYNEDLTDTLAKVTTLGEVKNLLNNHVAATHQLDYTHSNTQKFVQFVLLARGIEDYSNQYYDYWDYENRTANKADQGFVDEIESVYQQTDKKDAFYQNRLWFQVLRTKFYSADRASVIPFFEKTVKNQPKNSLYYRGLSYVAGAYKKIKNYEKSNALFAQIFDEFEPLMPAVLFDYKPLPKNQFEKSTKLADNQSNREAMHALQGYYTNGFEQMKQLYAENPQSKHLDFLLSRWVNINEQNINIYTAYDYLEGIDSDKVKAELKSKIDTDELAWINQVADEQKVSNLYVWKTAAAYFNSFVGEYKKADNQLKEAYRLTKNLPQKSQVRSLRLFNNLLSIDKVDLAAKAKLIEDVNWLFYDKNNVEYDYEADHRVSYLQTFTKKYLSSLYRAQKDDLMAELTHPIKGFYKDKQQSVAMEKLLLSSERTAWQDIFVEIYPYKLADIYESRGIYYFYEDEIDLAIAEFEKILPFEFREYNWRTEEYETRTVDYKATELMGNPFNGKIKDCNDCDHKAKQSVKYSQLTFLKKVKEMKDKIAAGDDVFNNAWLVGNAFYNASYFGNARVFYYNSIIDEYSNKISAEHEHMLYSMSIVKKYYALAQKHAQTDEQKAKMAYMMAKVERNQFYANQYYMPSDYFYPYGDFVSFKAWDGFAALKNEYSDTKYYREVINECGYFRKYLGLE